MTTWNDGRSRAPLTALHPASICGRSRRMRGHLAAAARITLPALALHRGWVMSIRNWPTAERPRERLIEHGAQALSDGELLAVLIGCGNRGRTAVDLARNLLGAFGSLRDFLNADRDTC